MSVSGRLLHDCVGEFAVRIEIAPQCSSEKHRLLRDHRESLSENVQTESREVYTVDQNAALRCFEDTK